MFRLVNAELDAAQIFLRDAFLHRDSDPALVYYNRHHARCSYETIVRYLPRLKLAETQQQNWEMKVVAIHRELQELGEVFE